MALKIKVKRIAGVPSTSNLETGEIGLNTSNNQLYVNIGGTITAVSGGTSGAEENESSFKTISVSGQDNVVADADADTLTLAAGSNMTITTNATSDTITFASTDTTLSLIDEDNMATDSATRPPSQQSVKAYVDGSTPNLSSYAGDIVPDGNGTRDLGSSSNRWAELYLSGGTMYLGSAQLTADGTKVVLPKGTKDTDGNEISLIDSSLGVAIRKVPLYTVAGGLSTAAKIFNMKTTQDRSLVFSDFTKANGDAISKHPGTTLFEF